MTLKFESTTNELRKGWNFEWCHHLTHITCLHKLRGLRQKSGCTSGINWTISFEVWGFQTKTHLLQRHFIFLNFFELKTFCEFNMHHSKQHTKIWTLSNFICYFSCITDLFCAKWPWNWKALQMNSEKVETWHGIIIWPT